MKPTASGAGSLRLTSDALPGLTRSAETIPIGDKMSRGVSTLIDSFGGAPLNLPERLILVAKRLPLEVKRTSKDGNVNWSIKAALAGPIAASIKHLREKYSVQVTCVGTLPEDVPPSEQIGLNEKLLKDFDCVPVYLANNNHSQWLYFCKSFLWPLLNSQLVQGSRNFEENSWKEYLLANEAFSRTISRFATGKDAIWVHDYHLIPLLSMLREHGFLNNRIGYFWHTPFPTSEIFRIIPVRAALLKATGGADLIGFQTYHDMRHYLSACARILAVDVGKDRVIIQGREVFASIFPAGADPDLVAETLEQEETKQSIAKLKKAFKGKKIIVGRDRLDTIKGIPQKLHAYEEFLKRYPEWKGKVVLLQSCTQASTESDLAEQINMLVAEINGRWAESDYVPIHFLNKPSVSYSDIMAILSAADVCLLTPVRDGMNLTAQEYVLAQRATQNPLILSEFAGSSQSLSGAVLVNPWDTRGIADTLHTVLKMDEKERSIKHKSSFEYCTRNTSSFWATTFLDALMDLNKESKTVPELSTGKIKADYKLSNKRLLLLDYDGTLVPIASLPSLAVPPDDLKATIEKLVADPKNIVYIITGRKSDFMETHFGDLPVGLCCEHGVLFKPHGPGKRPIQDLTSSMEMNDSWKEVVIPIFQDYSEVTPHTWVEEKTHSIAWHYRNADPDFALFQTKELIVHLQNVASGLPIEIMLGRKVVEVRSQSFNKGTAIRHILNQEACVETDFLLALGDDRTDEDMFSAVGTLATKPAHSYTVSVARKETNAEFILPTQASVKHLLASFTSLA